MARSNTANVANYIQEGSTPITANPVSMSCWFNANNLTVSSVLMAISNAGATAYHALVFDGANAYGLGDDRVIIDSDGVAFAASASAIGSAGVWNQMGFVAASNTSRIAYLNGVAGTTETTNRGPSLWNHLNLGALRSTTTTFRPVDGAFGECGMWNAALTTAEMAILAKGYSPLFVRPNNLVRYWPVIGYGTVEAQRVSAVTAAITGTMARAPHCPVIYPGSHLRGQVSAGLSAIDGTLNVTLDTITPGITGTLKIAGSVGVTLGTITPSLTADLLIHGALAQTLAQIVPTITGDLGVSISASMLQTLGIIVPTISGDLIISGSMLQTLGAVVPSMTSKLMIAGIMNNTLAQVGIAATGTLGIDGSVGVTLTPVVLNAAGALNIKGSVGLTLAQIMPTIVGDLVGAAINGSLNVTIEPIVLNATGEGGDLSGDGSGLFLLRRRRRMIRN